MTIGSYDAEVLANVLSDTGAEPHAKASKLQSLANKLGIEAHEDAAQASSTESSSDEDKDQAPSEEKKQWEDAFNKEGKFDLRKPQA